MENALQELCAVDGVLGCLLMSEDGIAIASHFDVTRDPERVAALTSSLVALVQRAASELGLGPFQSMMLEVEKSLLLVRQTSTGLLVVMGTRRANPGLLRVEMDLAAERVERRVRVE